MPPWLQKLRLKTSLTISGKFDGILLYCHREEQRNMALPRGNREQVTFKRSIEVVILMLILVSNDFEHNVTLILFTDVCLT